MDTTTRERIKKDFQTHDRDTGSSEVQIALLTQRIANITQHLKTHKQDLSSRRGLLMLVNKRRKLLDYLHDKDNESYKKILKDLNLRR